MKNKIITISFLIIVFGIFFANMIKPDEALSYGERRRLAQFPEISAKTVFSAKAMEDFDKYAADQFIWREHFRKIKTFMDRNILFKLDTNGLFQAFGGIFSIEYPLHKDKVLHMCQRMDTLYNRYLSGMNVYYTLIPDKNYYLPDGNYLLMDYEAMARIMEQNMPVHAKYIDMFNQLSLSNYYKSDGHWRQETLKSVVDTLNQAMGNGGAPFDLAQYEQKSYQPFYGAYYGQLAGMAVPDTLVWLENEITRDATLASLGHPGQKDLPIYYIDGLGGMDSYDVYLYGAQPLISIENPHNPEGKELILFRDSYGSSLAPLLLESYFRIIIVDLRYITQELLQDYINFENQDVLLMYSTTIVNNSDIIR